MIDLKETNKNDPLKRNVEKGLEGEQETSPFAPPEYDQPPGNVDPIPEGKEPAIVKKLMEEHEEAEEKIKAFENALQTMADNQWVLSQELQQTFSEFFRYLDEELLSHHSKEEKVLFPLLEERLMDAGEHSKYMTKGQKYNTAIDLMEDEHKKCDQLSAVVFNLLGVAPRLPDVASQSMVYDLIYHKGLELVETLRLHIYKENNTLFPLAYQLISEEEFKVMEKELDKFV